MTTPVPTVLMQASYRFAGVVPASPSGTDYTASVGEVIPVLVVDQIFMANLGFVTIPGYDGTVASGSGITELTGDVTAGPGSGAQVATLAEIPLAVFEALLTSLGTVAVDGAWRNGNVICLGTVTP